MAAPKPNTRHGIIEAALAEFAESGYDRTTMDEIARRAGVAKGSLYYHFPSKEALFHALFEERAERLAAVTRAGVAQSQWVGAMQAWTDFFWEQRAFLELFLSEAWRNREREALVQRFLQQIVAPLVPILQQPDVSPELLGYALFGALAVPAVHLLKTPHPDRQQLNDLVHTLSRWIAAQTP